MPTKLAEFFAAGVRPIQFGGNEEISRLVADAQSGMVLQDLDDGILRQAASLIAADAPRARIYDARNRTRQYLGLEAGVEAYAKLLRDVYERQSERGAS
jgi:glycosyltransferase involved in cell wall biosynthesis